MSKEGHIGKLVAIHTRRLQKLKEQRALQGSGVDPKIELEIEDIEAQLQVLQKELKEIERSEQEVPSPPPYIPFTNREDEIKLILSSFAPAYYLLDAPAGYGKTELMKEVERRFEEQGWLCAYVSIEMHDTLANLATRLAGKLGVIPAQDPELPWSWRLGGPLQKQWKNEPKEGLILLMDFKKGPSTTILRELLEEFIPNVQDSLRHLEFFSGKHNRFRVILAGRYLAARQEVKLTALTFKTLRLSPFDHNVIQESVGEYLTGYQEDYISQFAAHLVWLTGGHPGCMAQSLRMYAESGMPPDVFIRFFGRRIWKDTVRRVVDDIYDDVPANTKKLHNILDRLSIFRYLDSTILRYMIKADSISEVKSEHDLADELMATYLLDRKGRFLKDDITRRLMTLRLRNVMSEEFARRCQQAREMCLNRLRKPNVQRPEIWAIEYLFQSLQQYAYDIQEAPARQRIRETFFEEDVPRALTTMITDRNIPPAEMPDEKNALKQAIDEDWEFCFTVNYFLHQDLYSNEPYEMMLKQIEKFFGQKGGTRDGAAS